MSRRQGISSYGIDFVCVYEQRKKWYVELTHWGWVTHICVSKLTIIGSDNGLLPGRCQVIIWTSAGILLIGTNFNEILIKILTFPFKKIHLKMLFAKWCLFHLVPNVLAKMLGVIVYRVAVCWVSVSNQGSVVFTGPWITWFQQACLSIGPWLT